MVEPFNPADAACWIARGRPVLRAEAIADAWQRFPDVEPDAPLEERIARTRERVSVLRPLHEAIAAETEAARQRDNFACAERQIAAGGTDPRYPLILRARDACGYDWNAAWAYADGFHAARAGWDSRYVGAERARDLDARRRAYDHGFRDGGGRPDDLFDTARRALLAPLPAHPVEPDKPVSIPLPSSWPNPTDRPAPVSWRRRLLILSASEVADGQYGFLAAMEALPGSDQASVLLVDGPELRPYTLGSDRGASAPSLDAMLAAGDFDDLLVAVRDADLATVDRLARRLPLVRNAERTRNSIQQQRAQFRLWLARGRAPGTQHAAGHIRWSKMAAGLSGRLGTFTARYVGPAVPRGHRIIVEDADGTPARGYRAADGTELSPETIISNRAHLRAVLADQLRQFGAALRF